MRAHANNWREGARARFSRRDTFEFCHIKVAGISRNNEMEIAFRSAGGAARECVCANEQERHVSRETFLK